MKEIKTDRLRDPDEFHSATYETGTDEPSTAEHPLFRYLSDEMEESEYPTRSHPNLLYCLYPLNLMVLSNQGLLHTVASLRALRTPVSNPCSLTPS